MEIPLAEAVAVVRDELLSAVARGASSDVKFAVGEVRLEFEVQLREDKGSKLGFKAWVLTGERSRSTDSGGADCAFHLSFLLQRVVLTLERCRERSSSTP